MTITDEIATDGGGGAQDGPLVLSVPADWSETDLKNVAVRVAHYVTNYIINKIPSFKLRHIWYRKLLGAEIAPGACIYLNCFVWFFGPSQVRRTGLSVGRYSRVNRNCCLDARGPVRIGDNVSISPDVHILTTYHLHNSPNFRTATLPVVIDDYAWIGSRATILPGTTIGRGAVVAAGSVVRGNVPPFAVVAGTPAKQIGERSRDAVNYSLTWPPPFFE